MGNGLPTVIRRESIPNERISRANVRVMALLAAVFDVDLSLLGWEKSKCRSEKSLVVPPSRTLVIALVVRPGEAEKDFSFVIQGSARIPFNTLIGFGSNTEIHAGMLNIKRFLRDYIYQATRV